jgi:RNA polymerase sigma factor for flagellar operon FliA
MGETLTSSPPLDPGSSPAALPRLWHEYAQDHDSALRQLLIEAYAPLARYVVDRLNVRPGPALGYDDLLAQAVVGLIDALDRFDPTRGIRFETYAYHRIRGAVIDMLRDMDWVPRSVRQKEAQLARVCARLEAELGRPPTETEVADALGLSLGEFDQLAQGVTFQAVQSLEDAVGPQAQEAATIGDLIADEDDLSPSDHVARQCEREMLAQAIELLPHCERTVINLYYYEGLTLKDIGRALGVTESRACQIHGKAIVRLRAHVAADLQPRGRP